MSETDLCPGCGEPLDVDRLCNNYDCTRYSLKRLRPPEDQDNGLCIPWPISLVVGAVALLLFYLIFMA